MVSVVIKFEIWDTNMRGENEVLNFNIVIFDRINFIYLFPSFSGSTQFAASS